MVSDRGRRLDHAPKLDGRALQRLSPIFNARGIMFWECLQTPWEAEADPRVTNLSPEIAGSHRAFRKMATTPQNLISAATLWA